MDTIEVDLDPADYNIKEPSKPKKIVMVKEFLDAEISPRRAKIQEEPRTSGLPPRGRNKSNFAHSRKLSRD